MRIFQFDDPRMQRAYTSPGDFLAAKTTAEKARMMEWGATHVAQLDRVGALRALDTLRKPRASALLINGQTFA